LKLLGALPALHGRASPPSWRLGLKLLKGIVLDALLIVASLAEAWIETISSRLREFAILRRPLCGGIETMSESCSGRMRIVASCVGAWIETYDEMCRKSIGQSHPCVKVWIETTLS